LYLKGEKIEYPKCSNGNCMHNDNYFCKADDRLNEDIVCKQGKADAIKKIRMINTNEE
jgi:hypothetical protein